MKDFFTIGEVAGLFHMNIRTLRYYDDIGLLHPERTDPGTGYRYYTVRQFERLNTIKYLRALDLPLKKILHFFENRDVDVLRGLLQEQKQETQDKIRSLRQIERKLEHRLEDLEDALGPGREDIRCEYFEKRQIAFLRREIPLEENLEYPIRELEQVNMLESVMFLGKVGVSICVRDMEQQQFDRFSGIFVLLEQEDNYQGEERFLPEGKYVCVRFTGTHREAREYYRRLFAFMEEQEYDCAGDSVEITLIDSGFTNDTSRFVTELQIPVKRKPSRPRAAGCKYE